MLRGALIAICLAVPVSVHAQQRNAGEDAILEAAPQSPRPATLDANVGRTATTGTGRIGQRQTREEAAPNVQPLNRIQNRIASRVQNRNRNRIDRYYDPQANAASPFEVASDQARVAGRGPR